MLAIAVYETGDRDAELLVRMAETAGIDMRALRTADR